MVADPGNALQVAIVSALLGDPAFIALVGGEPRVFDDVPARTAYPYVTIGQSLQRDWAAGTDPGCEHTVTLHVWSQAYGRREAAEIASALRAALHDRPLEPQGHRLINIRHEFTETRRETDGSTYRALVRFRAVTEPA